MLVYKGSCLCRNICKTNFGLLSFTDANGRIESVDCLHRIGFGPDLMYAGFFTSLTYINFYILWLRVLD